MQHELEKDKAKRNVVRSQEDEKEKIVTPPEFKFIEAKRVRKISTANIVCLEPCPFLEDCLEYHDDLVRKGRKSKIHKQVHDSIGVANCEYSGELTGQCKLAFKENFSKELVMKHAAAVGVKNMYEEDYWSGDEVYSKGSAEARFYELYRILKGSKSNFIEDYINKIWYLVGQRAPTMNFWEKLIRSPYGRPFYKMITGMEVPQSL